MKLDERQMARVIDASVLRQVERDVHFLTRFVPNAQSSRDSTCAKAGSCMQTAA